MAAEDVLAGFELNEERFMGLLEKLIGESEFVQNKPPELVPEEDRIINHVKAVLAPYSEEEGGPLKLEHISFVEGRGNLIITYPGTVEGKIVSLVGSHMDVVPADPETWDRNPFELVVEGDKLYGRGTTDCLGHVALVTDLFASLGERKPALNSTVVAVFIASEENSSIPGIGVDKLVEAGHLDHLKAGPVLWIDSADSNPCIGTAGAITWKMTVHGKRFHSGLPHRAINPIELGMEALSEMQRRFYADFPAHEKEEEYKFATPSTMKPTQISCAKGSLNQIPPMAVFEGDIRLTPFYDVSAVLVKLREYEADLNSTLALPEHGPCSKYELPDEELRGRIELDISEETLDGIACKVDSPGFAAIDGATRDVRGESKPYSICGSLPLVGDLQRSGFDLQITGYGLSAAYHADNEYALLSKYKEATKILSRFIARLE